jgi:hypothetical protein
MRSTSHLNRALALALLAGSALLAGCGPDPAPMSRTTTTTEETTTRPPLLPPVASSTTTTQTRQFQQQ